MEYLSKEQLDAGLDYVREAPSAAGTVEMVVSRPETDQRLVLDAGEFVVGLGLAGDNYVERGSARTPDGAAHPEAQVTIMNSRAIDWITSGTKDMWKMAGDQLLVDFDISEQNLPAGTHLQVGGAVLEVSAKPHTGCNKFAARFGQPAALWVNSPAGKQLKLRGINAMVIAAGTVRPGDSIAKL
ncbi:MAG: MOSC domain-containing protein [Acidimicrobiales bacterium]|nr:MOSC domain-containing protein [Acidimicrobiales bacterium]